LIHDDLLHIKIKGRMTGKSTTAMKTVQELNDLSDEKVIDIRVVFVGKVSEGRRDRVTVAHQHKIGHLMPYTSRFSDQDMSPHPTLANTTLIDMTEDGDTGNGVRNLFYSRY